MTHRNGKNGHYKNLVFLSKTDKCKHLFLVARFQTVGRSGGLQTNLWGGLGVGAPSGIMEVTFRTCVQTPQFALIQ